MNSFDQPSDGQLALEKSLDESAHIRTWLHAIPEETLSLAWRSQLNEKLLGTAVAKEDATSQQPIESVPVRNWIQSLPEDVPSMAWRSQLNERLQSVKVPSSRPRGSASILKRPLLWGGVAAVTLSIAVYNSMTMAPNGNVSPLAARQSSVEEAIITAHVDMVAALDLDTSNTLEGNAKVSPRQSPYYWNESDLESL